MYPFMKDMIKCCNKLNKGKNNSTLKLWKRVYKKIQMNFFQLFIQKQIRKDHKVEILINYQIKLTFGIIISYITSKTNKIKKRMRLISNAHLNLK